MIAIDRLAIIHDNKPLVEIGLVIKSTLGLVGMSGSGKSLTLKALLEMLPSTMTRELEIDAPFPLVRGETVGFVPQNPFTALSPMSKIKHQFFARDPETLLKAVGLEPWVLERFPSELSGGQLQRVVLAVALEKKPKLLLLDEPTTALDSKSKETVLEVLGSLQRRMGFYTLFVTHDIAVARKLCAHLAVIRDGKIVESGLTEELVEHPATDYARELINASFAYREWRQ